MTKEETFQLMIKDNVDPKSLDLHFSPNKQRAYVVVKNQYEYRGETEIIESKLTSYIGVQKAQAFIEDYESLVKSR